MSKEIYISSTPHETRLAIVENDALTEIYYERENEYTLAGSIYNGKVTRVLPGMQSSFVEIGLERDAFLYITDFMEEAGDSADFDSQGNGEGHRSEGRRTEDRRDTRDRNGAPPTMEGSLAPSEALAGSGNRSSSERGGERGGDRNGRGERSRGRGRRDRGGNRDRQAVEGTGQTDAAEFARPAEFSAEDLPTERHDEPEVGEGVIGEGAAGADGSRRWRGRRGRRRGRGPGQRDESPQISPQSAGAAGAAEGSPDMLDETSYEGTFELDAAAVAPGPVASTTAPASSAASTTEATSFSQEDAGRGERQNRGDRSGRDDRNSRDERRGRGDRGGRDQRAPRVPRGFAPKTALYGVDDSPAYNESNGSNERSDSGSEPIILPGESLSKYRKGGDEATTAAASAAAEPSFLTPSTPSFAIPEGWDGGATLPGESLSRQRRSESGSGGRSGGRAEHREDPRASDRNRRETVLPRAQVIHEAEGVSVAESIEEQPEILLAAHPDLISAGRFEREPVSVAQASISSEHEAEAAAEPSALAKPAEYEPTDASASYRIDPAAPSEFRQSAPVLEAPQEEEHAEPEAREPKAYEASETHSITPGPGEHVAPLRMEAQPAYDAQPVYDAQPAYEKTASTHERFDWQTGPVKAAETSPEPHQITTLHATGELHSEPPIATFTPEHATETVSPIDQETAIASSSDDAVTQDVAPQDVAPRQFAPGAGVLEEETLDEEDFNTTLHASSIEEMDDFDEEETLEGAADLGTMIREMSIDQITRSGNVDEEEEDDLEEQDAVYHPTDMEVSEEEDEELDEADTEEDVLHEEFAEGSEAGPNGFDRNGSEVSRVAAPGTDRGLDRGADRGGDRGRGRRDGRRGERFGRGSERPRHTGGAGDRERSGGGRDRRGGRSSMQSTNLPAISELLKPGQEILVQIAKEPIAKKGARITSHIALPGRFLVFMPTVNHTGVSRKIESDGERRRLKEILLSEKGEASGGFIVRTAASGASEEELRSDLRFLLNLWADIKQRSESSKSPALIYHDLNLVERILRDQVTDTFSAIWVDSEGEYERVLRFLQRFQPSLIRRVKLYTKETPLFEQFGITEEINKALRSKVWLKSGGSIVINQTEALVAIDINTGKFVGKTARLEDTIVKTNLDAIPEIVRQIRLRDLGGIIIIDFIDMDERKNRNRVMSALEEELKNDRAPSKVLQFNDFGLVAITRKRVKQSLERTLSTTCNVCVGTGMVKSPVTVCNDIYIEMRKMQKHLDRGDIMLRVNPEVVKQLKAPGTKWLQEMEEMAGKTILVKSDPSLHPEQFDIH